MVEAMLKELWRLEEAAGGGERAKPKAGASFMAILIQIAVLDMVFSLDSVITAVGMVDEIAIMVTAVIVAMIVMLIFVDTVSSFIDQHPTFKILALSFLILIGFVLVLEGVHREIPKGYIYFAMAFSFGWTA